MTSKRSNKKAAELIADIHAVNSEVETILESEAQVETVEETVVEAPKLDVALTEFDKDELVDPTDLDVYFGNGEFALSKKNIVKVTEALKHYNETGNWSWKLQDVIGVNRKGTLSKKFQDIIATLHTVKIEEVQNLISVMNLTVERKPEEVIYVPSKNTAVDKTARRAEVTEILKNIEGLSDIEKVRMVKAI